MTKKPENVSISEKHSDDVDMIPLKKAAEVLAKVHGDRPDWGQPWDMLSEEQKQEYIDRALEELKK